MALPHLYGQMMDARKKKEFFYNKVRKENLKESSENDYIIVL